jgi:hypothetical protein
LKLNIIGCLVSSVVIGARVATKGNVCICKLFKLDGPFSGKIEIVFRGVSTGLLDPGIPVNLFNQIFCFFFSVVRIDPKLK